MIKMSTNTNVTKHLVLQFGLIVFAIALTGCSGWAVVEQTPVLYTSLREKDPSYVQYFKELPPSQLATTQLSKVDLDPYRKAGELSDLSSYLEESLPLINEYLSKHYTVVENSLPVLENPVVLSDVVSHNPEKNQLSTVTGFDMPKVGFGNPKWLIDEYDLLYSGRKQNVMVVVDGSEKWRQHYIQHSERKNPLLEIRLGLIEVTATNREGKRIDFEKEFKLGSQIRLDRGKWASDEWPINVVAFKGLLYDEKGNLVAAGIEGFLPIYPDDGYIDIDLNPMKILFGFESVHLNQQVDNLEEFYKYPWKKALDGLIQNLLISKGS